MSNYAGYLKKLIKEKLLKSRIVCELRAEHSYRKWLRSREKRKEKGTIPEAGKERPLFSVILLSGNKTGGRWSRTRDSVLRQTCRAYECISEADLASAAARAAGTYFIIPEEGALLDAELLRRFSELLAEKPELDLIYCDEDRYVVNGALRCRPFFKPDWSPDLIWSVPFVGCSAAFRGDTVKKILREKEMTADFAGEAGRYAFLLKFLGVTENRRIGHVPEILCHIPGRPGKTVFDPSAGEDGEACCMAAEKRIRRENLDARMERIPGIDRFRIVYGTWRNPLVSIIIPSKDHPEMLGQCVRSIRELTDYKNYEILVVDNGSSPENEIQIRRLLEECGAVYLYAKETFNFSRMCNRGAAAAKGEYFLFLNDDIRIIQPDWLRRMLGQAMQPHTGAVGAKLLYPDSGLIQHAGVSNTEDGPCHSFMMGREDFAYYYPYHKLNYNCLAVTGACLMVERRKFLEAGGFDESYPVAYNDVKLCFSLHRAGYYQVVRNDAAAYHYESYSRGLDALDEQKQKRLREELERLFRDYPEFRGKDPFLNPNLTHCSYTLSLRTGGPWNEQKS